MAGWRSDDHHSRVKVPYTELWMAGRPLVPAARYPDWVEAVQYMCRYTRAVCLLMLTLDMRVDGADPRGHSKHGEEAVDCRCNSSRRSVALACVGDDSSL